MGREVFRVVEQRLGLAGFLTVEVIRPTEIEGPEFLEVSHAIVHFAALTDWADRGVV